MAKRPDSERNFEVHTNPHPGPLVRDIPNVLRTATPEELEQIERDVRALAALQKWDGKRFWKKRKIVFALEDVEAFTELLKASFPRIRFLNEQALGSRKHAAFGSVHIDRCEPKLRYFDSLADPDQKWFLCWVEPEGWEPKIGPTRFEIGTVTTYDASGAEVAEDPTPAPEDPEDPEDPRSPEEADP